MPLPGRFAPADRPAIALSDQHRQHADDDAVLRATSRFVRRHRVDTVQYMILTPMPGTVLYRQVKDRIVDHDLSKYNFFNSVMKTAMPAEKFYESVGALWKIKLGRDVI